ncbi:hypothetical protein THOM_2990 [Trachipleistophora hominis]|uniref:Uncharacterized protein n=1 Tax=Trachipleistophora hominis TaxID=72359 RepID=L7JRN6_TRAHO|nr:hypothetical protein THOM_2990 [Trachipleistophora hominis]
MMTKHPLFHCSKPDTPKLLFTSSHVDIKGENIQSFHINMVIDNLYAIPNYLLIQQSSTIIIYRYKIKNTKGNKNRIILAKIKKIENHILNYLVNRVSRQVLRLLFNVMLTLVSKNVKACNREMEKIILWMKISDIVDVHIGECVKVWDRYGVVKTYYNDASDGEQIAERRDDKNKTDDKGGKQYAAKDNAKETMSDQSSSVSLTKLVNDNFSLECKNNKLRMNYFKRSFVENLNLVGVVDFVCVNSTVFVLLKSGVEVLLFS